MPHPSYGMNIYKWNDEKTGKVVAVVELLALFSFGILEMYHVM